MSIRKTSTVAGVQVSNYAGVAPTSHSTVTESENVGNSTPLELDAYMLLVSLNVVRKDL